MLLWILLAFVSLVNADQHVLRTPKVDLLARLQPSQSGVIAQLFEWSHASVEAECAFLGRAGYAAVQVSPPQEHVQGTEWWTVYQPVSYEIASRRGNITEFASMIDVCGRVGIAVIVDTVLNHMTGRNEGVGTGGSRFTHYDYPGTYSSRDFHGCRHGIEDWQDRQEVQTCELVGLADLDTESSYVRATLANYTERLLSLGAAGFRLDASKHIDSASLHRILAHAQQPYYSTAEVLAGSRSIDPAEYLVLGGDVHDLRYAEDLSAVFRSRGDIVNLRHIVKDDYLPSERANTFVANHDSERNPDMLSYRWQEAYVLASIFALSWPYGRPTVLSSYAFDNFDQGAPADGHGDCSDKRWLCQHRSFANMVSFHNAMADSNVSSWSSPSPQRIYYGRGSTGLVALNNAGSPWLLRERVDISDGVYCDAAWTTPGCHGPLRVRNGTLTIDVAPRSAIALYNSAKSIETVPPVAPVATLMISVHAETAFSEVIYIVGNTSQLGSWEPHKAILLSATDYSRWTANVTLPASQTIEYKYIRQQLDDRFVPTSYAIRVDIGSAGSSAEESASDGEAAPVMSERAKGKRRARDSSEDSMISEFAVDSEKAAAEEEGEEDASSDGDDASAEDGSIVPEEPEASAESEPEVRPVLLERKGRVAAIIPTVSASRPNTKKGGMGGGSGMGTPGNFDYRLPSYAQSTGITYHLKPTYRLPGNFDDASANFGHGKPLVVQEIGGQVLRLSLSKAWINCAFGLVGPLVETIGWYKRYSSPGEPEMIAPIFEPIAAEQLEPYLPSQSYPAKPSSTFGLVLDASSVPSLPTADHSMMEVDVDGEVPAPDETALEENDGATTCFLGSMASEEQMQTKVDFARFESHRLDEYILRKPGYILNAGGPVFGMDWCPHDDSQRPSDAEYLAVATYARPRTASPSPAPALPSDEPGLIQIWALPTLSASDFGRQAGDDRGPAMHLVLGLCIDVGEGWALQWRPLRTGYPHHQSLGHLAGCFGDGSLCIFDVPQPGLVPRPALGATPYIRCRPRMRLSLPDAAINCLDWASHDTLVGGCGNGNIAVWHVGEALRLRLPTVRPSIYVGTDTSPLISICVQRIPPLSADGQDLAEEEPTSIFASSFSAAYHQLDIRDPYISAQVTYERGSGNPVTWSPFLCCSLYVDADQAVRLLSLRPRSYGQTARMATLSGRINDVAANQYSPFYAAAGANGALAVDNITRHQVRHTGATYHARPVYRIDFDRKAGVYRMIDNEVPSAHAANRGSTLGDGMPTPPAWPPQVAINRVAWCRSLRRAQLLASGTASGLVRVDIVVDEVDESLTDQEMKELWATRM